MSTAATPLVDFSTARRLRSQAVALLAVTKPRIIELLLITTVPAMVLAADGWPGSAVVAFTLVGGAFCAGAANALNCVLDLDRDAVMERTARRPLVTGELTPWAVIWFGMVLGVSGSLLLAVTVNVLTSVITTAAMAFYVLVYTAVLKRRTQYNIVIGGAAGAAPVLAGWSAVTGGLDISAWLMFGIVFLWTPPHFWALAIAYRDDYAAAEIPMLPVVAGDRRTARSATRYAAALIPTTLVLGVTAGMSAFFTIGATALGVWFAWSSRRMAAPGTAMHVFRDSITYLTAVFLLIALDVLIV